MEIRKALSQLDEIHGHLAKTEVYRGYRSFPLALSGVIAFLGGLFQTSFVQDAAPRTFVIFWATLAALNFLIIAGEIAFNYLFRSTTIARRTTRKAVGQLVPTLGAGAVVTLALTLTEQNYIPLLPGIWVILFGLGIFASRPYLPRAIGWVTLFYLLAGAVLLWLARGGLMPLPMGLGLTFGVGQIFAALVIYWNLERRDDV